MAERSSSSRWTHFLMMLPFFLIGIAIPVYFYGFSGDGPAVSPTSAIESQDRRFGPSSRDSGIVNATRDAFDRPAREYGERGGSRLLVQLGLLAGLFVAGFFIVRILLHVFTGAIGSIGNFLVHKAAGPMFMGFLSVGSTWGIHQTVADEFGMTWAAATIAITAAIATLFALAGVRVR
jgi:hypothetical protein